ncbi:MAG: YihY/virulence factor BrkB family protein [Actinomycetota bacterium]
MSGAAQKLIKRFDQYQRNHPILAFPIAVAKKFTDDRAGFLAALVAYYAFFSIFPLLLVFVSVLGFVLGENSEFRQKVLDSVLAQIPVIGSQISQNINAIEGSGFALVIGLITALLAGLGVIQALQHGMDQIWNVPVVKRPKFLASRLRGFIMLATLGVLALGSTVISGIGASQEGPLKPMLTIIGVVASLALNFGAFLIAFKVLTIADVSWRDVAPGAAVGAVSWAILQALGGYIVRNQLTLASDVYGFFAIVIGLLSWLYIGAQLTFVAAEINAVRARRLWPRSLDPEYDLTAAEREALTLTGLATQEERLLREDVDVEFKPANQQWPG